MKFFPYYSYTIKSSLTPDEIRQKLADNIEPKKLFRFNFLSRNLTKPYEGEINGDTFNIRRIISGRDSFLPRIKGQISTTIDTEVHIVMRMALYTYIVLLTVNGALIYGLILAINSMLLHRQFNAAFLILPAMLVISYLFAFLSFKYESSKSKTFLDSLFITN